MHQYTEDRLVSMSMPLYSWPSLASLKVGLLANMVFPEEDQQSQSPRPLETLRSLEVKGRALVRRSFARLRSLHISHCTNLGQEVLEGSSFEENLPLLQLERLSIQSCDNLTQGSPCLLQLERLSIQSCDSLTRIPMLPASLEQLDISRCRSTVALPRTLEILRS